jgi:lipopolysaccharide biosynthesis protein
MIENQKSKIKKTIFSEANKLFRKAEYEGALRAYKIALSNFPEFCEYIKFNIQLTIKRLEKIDNIDKCSNELMKPESVDKYFFIKIKESGLFDVLWYLEEYGDKYEIKINPLEHYLKHGIDLNLNPSSGFNTVYYVKTNPDVENSALHPFLHYIVQGANEGRVPIEPLTLDYQSNYTIMEPKYIPRIEPSNIPLQKSVRVIAFYLPQFHTIPENDNWWGSGFTEWTNVKPALPQYDGHYQPHIPDDYIGYYNLLDDNTQAKQVELAKQYGVEGFCFYLYWFTGHKLLEQPVDNYFKNKNLDLPYCVCWANENWSRRWDGLEQDLLMEQHYSEEDDIKFIENVSKYLRDSRYIRIENKALLLVYRPKLFPDMKATSRRWREWCINNGVGEIYLTYPQSFETADPAEYGFDAACEFPPNNSSPPNITYTVKPLSENFETTVYDWRIFVARSENYVDPGYKLFRSVTPSWDNTARKKNKGIVFENSCPKIFEKWITNAFVDASTNRINDEKIVFVNAWNEWAEGAHLEPDKRYGFAWLNSILNAHRKSSIIDTVKIAFIVHVFYIDVYKSIIDAINKFKFKNIKVYITTTDELYSEVSEIAKKINFENEVFRYKNHGRDVLPFLKVIKEIPISDHDYFIKIHTKKSRHRGDGDEWREEIFNDLLNFDKLLNAVFLMQEDPEIYLASPSNQLVNMTYYWGSNKENIENLAKKYLQISLSDIEKMNFIAGTMFMCSSSYLEVIDFFNLQDLDFEDEMGQIDGTIAHAIERFLSIVCQNKNKKILSINLNGVNNNFSFADKSMDVK